MVSIFNLRTIIVSYRRERSEDDLTQAVRKVVQGHVTHGLTQVISSFFSMYIQMCFENIECSID